MRYAIEAASFEEALNKLVALFKLETRNSIGRYVAKLHCGTTVSITFRNPKPCSVKKRGAK